MIRFLQTPGPIKKVILSGILLIFCGAMVITLIPGGLGSNFGVGAPGAGVVAKVGGETVTVPEVQLQAKQMVRQQFPRGGPQANALMQYFAPQAAQQLISEKAIVAEGRRMGLKASDEEVRDELQHGPLAQYLFPDGNFIGQDGYEDFVSRAFEMSIPQFEQAEKDSIVGRKLRLLVAGSVIVSDGDVKAEFLKRNTKVKFDYAAISMDEVRKSIHPTDEELKAFYQRNQASYKNAIPEKRKIKYVLIDTTKLTAQTQVSPAELQAYYDQHREEYRVPEQVKVSHILIKTPLPGADAKIDPKGLEAARAKAQDILKQLKSGAKFEELAKKNSEDPGSAKNGGDLGWIGRGRTVPEFEKVAFSLPKGQVSDLVQSSYGFHIIRVDDKQEAHVKTLDEVKAQIEPILKQQKASATAQTEADALLSDARSGGLDKAATTSHKDVVTTDFFSRVETLPGIGAAPQFMEAVFAAQPKSPPDLVKLPQGFAVFELEGVQPAATPGFEQIRSRVEDEFKNERAAAMLAQKTQELSDRAKSAHDLRKAAKELGAAVKTSDLVAPDGQVPDIGSMAGPASVAFSMKPGEISNSIMNESNGVVIALLDKQLPGDQEFAQKKDEVRESLLQAKQNELFGLFVDNLRKQMEKAGKIKINEQELKNLSHPQNSEEGI